MASNTITTTRTVTLDCNVDEARQRILSAIASRNGKIVDNGGAMVAKFGSQAMMRLVGGWFISASSLPVRSKVTFEAVGDRTVVTIGVGDAMGVGMKTGMNDKFTTAVGELAGVLASA